MSEIQCSNCGARFEPDTTEFCPAAGCGFPVAFMTLDDGEGPEEEDSGDILRRPDDHLPAPEVVDPPPDPAPAPPPEPSSPAPPLEPSSPAPGMMEVPESPSAASPGVQSPAVHPGVPQNHGGTPWLDTEEFGSRNRRLVGLIALIGLAVVVFALMAELFGIGEAWAPIRELVVVPSIGHLAIMPTALVTATHEATAPRRPR